MITLEALKRIGGLASLQKKDSSSTYTGFAAGSPPTLDNFTSIVSMMPFLRVGEMDFDEGMKAIRASENAMLLRNMLRLPKAYRWVCCEWFYSDIDRIIFEEEFENCLRTAFPALKTRKLRRVEWNHIKKALGRPRRFSHSFAQQERMELKYRREKIRQIQKRQLPADFTYKDLPDDIPIHYVIGTRVSALLRKPLLDGIFTGTVDGVDVSNNTYRITFDRASIGTQSVVDYEVMSQSRPETMSILTIRMKLAGTTVTIPGDYERRSVFRVAYSDPSHADKKLISGFLRPRYPADLVLGCFPLHLLDLVIRLSKLLKLKYIKIQCLKELNVEAEKMWSYNVYFPKDFSNRYASCVSSLDCVSQDISAHLDGILVYLASVYSDNQDLQFLHSPTKVLERSKSKAEVLVSTFLLKQNVRTPKIKSMINELASMLFQVQEFSSDRRHHFELQSIKDTIQRLKRSVDGRNIRLFQNRIEIPMQRILAGLCV